MTDKRLLTALLFALIPLFMGGQTSEKSKKTGITFSGFVRNDIFLDSRLTVASREGSFLLWPEKISHDDRGNDINAVSNLNFLLINSRITATINGPDIAGTKMSGLIEADFAGQGSVYPGMLKLRHALVKMTWENSELLVGHFWNPLFVTDNYPTTVSLNSGAPFNSFARNPQIRYTVSAGKIKIVAAALTQSDFTSWASKGPGLSATASHSYLRNSAMPDIHLQAQYATTTSNNTVIAFGAAGAFKRIVPRQTSGGTLLLLGSYSVNEKVDGFTGVVFGRIVTKNFSIKLYSRYGENITDLLAPGGYAALAPLPEPPFSLDYRPLRNISWWLDIGAGKGNMQAGLFGGCLINRGTGKTIIHPDMVFGRAADIGSMIRLSPRFVFTSGTFKLSGEIEFTRAYYGDGTFTTRAIPQNQAPVNNLRLISTMIYSF